MHLRSKELVKCILISWDGLVYFWGAKTDQMNKTTRLQIEEEMRYHVQAWQQSAVSQKEYCRENNLSYHTFIYWIQKFRRNHIPVEQSFIAVQPNQQATSLPQELEIAYPNGVRVRIPTNDIQLIGQLLRLVWFYVWVNFSTFILSV